MENKEVTPEFQRISEKAVKLFFRQGLIASFFYIAVGMSVFWIFDFAWLLIPAALLTVYALLVHPRFEYRQWSYRITGRYIDIIHGIFFTQHVHIPVFRIQHLDIIQGPLQKSLKLASIIIVTAGMSHKIQAVDWAVGQRLLDEIRDIIYEEREHGRADSK